MTSDIYQNLLPMLIRHEGFRGYQYDDHLGHPTIGYGTLLPLTKSEAERLLLGRLEHFERGLADRLYSEYDLIFSGLPDSVQCALLSMVYQLGVTGLFKFKKMFKAIRQQNWLEAEHQALDSKWAKVQTPSRAKEVAKLLRNGA